MTLTVTCRSRIGFCWTNSPERWTDRHGQSHLRISPPGDVPEVKGYVRTVFAEYQHVAQKNNANDWACRWFVQHERKWLAVALDSIDLWMLTIHGKGVPVTDSIEVSVL